MQEFGANPVLSIVRFREQDINTDGINISRAYLSMAENLYPVHETFREYQIEKALLLAHNSPLRLEAEDPLARFSSSLPKCKQNKE